MKLVICIPSRGVIHSRTIDAVMTSVKRLTDSRAHKGERWVFGRDWDLLVQQDLPIPASHNTVIERALSLGPELIWLVEEDIGPDPEFLLEARELLFNPALVVVAPYRLRGGTWCHHLKDDGSVLYSGVGCMLIYSQVLTTLKRPWFQCSTEFDDKLEPQRIGIKESEGYGRHDVFFFSELWKAGIKTTMLKTPAKHFIVKELGKPGTNDGCHKIEEL